MVDIVAGLPVMVASGSERTKMNVCSVLVRRLPSGLVVLINACSDKNNVL